MHHHKFHIALMLGMAALLTACNPTKRVPQGEYLLVKNIVRSDAKELTNDELRSIIKQKPNNKVLGQRLYLHFHNLAGPEEKIERRQAVLAERCTLKQEKTLHKLEARNARREARGKAPVKLKDKDCRRPFRVWLRDDVGEAPVLLDSSLTARSATQLKLYLDKEGYFNAEVGDTVYFNASKPFTDERGVHFRRPMAEVEYRIKAGRPYTLCTVNWFVDDPAIDSLVGATWSASLLRYGTRFDADVLDKERTRLTDMLRSKGYLYFSKDLIHYVADTTAGEHEVDLQLRFERPLAKTHRGLSGTAEGTVYRLGNISVDMTGQSDLRKERLPVDTTTYKGRTFLFTGRRPAYRPKSLSSAVLLRTGTTYNATTSDRAFRRLTNLRVFDRVDIAFDTTQTAAPDIADCRILLLPSKRQGFSLEGFGTNRGGFLGTSVGLNYRHRNLLRSMGSIEAQMSLGLEAQQSLGSTGSTNEATTRVRQDVLFNTVEIGPEVTIRFPRFIIPGLNTDERWPRTWGRRTAINVLYNYQRRPDYTRTLGKMSFGYEWNKRQTISVAMYPAEVNLIRIPYMSDAFQGFISASNDAVLRDSYTDHVVAGGRAVVTVNTQGATPRRRNMLLWRPSIQLSGNLLYLANQAFNMASLTDADGKGYYTLAGVRFAQFVKVENDIRLHHRIHDKSSLAFRFDAGIGIPYGNLGVLPFESSFFSGGANGLRAWRARSLGPGSFRGLLNAYDRVGEIRLEGNAEYRFKLLGYFEGALFVDAGNIWNLKENPTQPGSGFEVGKAPGEIAFGTGIGARLNFDFFLVRFDLGLQTKDPSLPMGQRWIFQSKEPGFNTTFAQKLNLNLGIGYPF